MARIEVRALLDPGRRTTTEWRRAKVLDQRGIIWLSNENSTMRPSRRARRILLSLAITACLASELFVQYHFDHWTTENGLPENSIRALRQTRDGYLWMTTSSGMVRFDR